MVVAGGNLAEHYPAAAGGWPRQTRRHFVQIYEDSP